MPGIKEIQQRRGKIERPKVINNEREVWLEAEIDYHGAAPGIINLGGSFHPSVLGNPCDRFLYLHYRGMLPEQDISSQLQRIFDHGNVTQDRYKRYFQKMKLLVADEIRVIIDHPPIKGRADLLLKIPDSGDYLVEVKTINDRGFSALNGPKDEHRVQLQIYLNILEIERGGVLYENKNDQRVMIFGQQRDREFWDSIVKRCINIMDMKTLPNLGSVADIHDKRFCNCLGVRDGE